jgi:hypothetical protein
MSDEGVGSRRKSGAQQPKRPLGAQSQSKPSTKPEFPGVGLWKAVHETLSFGLLFERGGGP